MHAPLETCGGGVKEARETDAGLAGKARVRAAVTGTGLLTPLGLSAKESWEALLAGGYIRDHSPIPLPDGGTGRARVSELAIRAAREAVGESGWLDEDVASDRTALVVGTSKGPIESWVTPPLRLTGEGNVYGLAEVTADVARDLKLGRGARLTVSAACATGLHALIRGTMLIESGRAARVLVVAAESSLGPLFVGSFKRLGVLAQDGCRPFDVSRTGFLMSEGAAAVCLEPASAGDGGGVGIESYALGGDATHLTGGDRKGETLRHLIRSAMDERPVDFIHAHGTGTDINDATELVAIEESIGAIGQGGCPIYSHKGALGHSLGAAGLTAVALSCQVHRFGVVPPNVQTANPLPTRSGRIERGPVRRQVGRSLAIAAGFGGAAAVVALRS